MLSEFTELARSSVDKCIGSSGSWLDEGMILDLNLFTAFENLELRSSTLSAKLSNNGSSRQYIVFSTKSTCG